MNNEIEVNLRLVGSTAIEDRLQDNVADTIRFMKRTGIKVWVLTGDKVGTAINIGTAAGLLDKKMHQFKIQATNTTDLTQEVEEANPYVNDGRKRAIIIAGDSLSMIANDLMLQEKFCEASDHADVVLACRVSPQ